MRKLKGDSNTGAFPTVGYICFSMSSIKPRTVFGSWKYTTFLLGSTLTEVERRKKKIEMIPKKTKRNKMK